MSDLSGLRAAFGAWVERCLKRILLFVTVVAATGTAIVTAGAHWDSVRPWATRSEIAEFANGVANDLYPLSLADQQTKTLSLENRLKFLEENGKAGKNTPEQWLEIPVMKRLIDESKDKEAQIIKRQTRFRTFQEHR